MCDDFRHGGHLDNTFADDVQKLMTFLHIPSSLYPSKTFAHYLSILATVWTLGQKVEGINKDSMDCSWSSHGPKYHMAAASLAQDATINFIKQIRKAIADKQSEAVAEHHMRALFGFGTTLAFVVDTTGSMDDIQAQVRSELVKTVDSRAGTSDEVQKYVLSPFNDPAVDSTQVTLDVATFKSDINSLF